MIISVDSHDVLGKLSVVKNYISVAMESGTLPEKEKEYLKRAFEGNEALIAHIKEKTSKSA
jgi:hypothetical protein